MHFLTGAQFLQARIRRVPAFHRLLAQTFQPFQQGRVAQLGQPAVEETLRTGEDDAAIPVVLDLRVGPLPTRTGPIPL